MSDPNVEKKRPDESIDDTGSESDYSNDLAWNPDDPIAKKALSTHEQDVKETSPSLTEVKLTAGNQQITELPSNGAVVAFKTLLSNRLSPTDAKSSGRSLTTDAARREDTPATGAATAGADTVPVSYTAATDGDGDLLPVSKTPSLTADAALARRLGVQESDLASINAKAEALLTAKTTDNRELALEIAALQHHDSNLKTADALVMAGRSLKMAEAEPQLTSKDRLGILKDAQEFNTKRAEKGELPKFDSWKTPADLQKGLSECAYHCDLSKIMERLDRQWRGSDVESARSRALTRELLQNPEVAWQAAKAASPEALLSLRPDALSAVLKSMTQTNLRTIDKDRDQVIKKLEKVMDALLAKPSELPPELRESLSTAYEVATKGKTNGQTYLRTLALTEPGKIPDVSKLGFLPSDTTAMHNLAREFARSAPPHTVAQCLRQMDLIAKQATGSSATMLHMRVANFGETAVAELLKNTTDPAKLAALPTEDLALILRKSGKYTTRTQEEMLASALAEHAKNNKLKPADVVDLLRPNSPEPVRKVACELASNLPMSELKALKPAELKLFYEAWQKTIIGGNGHTRPKETARLFRSMLETDYKAPLPNDLREALFKPNSLNQPFFQDMPGELAAKAFSRMREMIESSADRGWKASATERLIEAAFPSPKFFAEPRAKDKGSTAAKGLEDGISYLSKEDLVWAAKELRKGVVDFLTSGDHAIPPGDAKKLVEALEQLAEKRSGQTMSEPLAKAVLDKLNDMGLTKEQRAKAIELLKARSEYLSITGLEAPFRALEQKLSLDGQYSRFVTPKGGRNGMSPSINILVGGEGSGASLGYHNLKVSEVHVNIHRMERVDGKTIITDPEGNRIQLHSDGDKVVGKKIYDAATHTTYTADKAPTVELPRFVLMDNPHDCGLKDAVGDLQKMQGNDRLLVPEEIVGTLDGKKKGFRGDVNLYDLAKAEASLKDDKKGVDELAEKLAEKVKGSGETVTPGKKDATIDATEVDAIRRAPETAESARTQLRALREAVRVYPDALKDLVDVAKAAEFRSLGDFAALSLQVRKNIETKLGSGRSITKDAIFVIPDVAGSEHFIHEMFRRMNPDISASQFVTMGQLEAMAKDGKLAGKDLVLLDDGFDFGKECLTQKLQPTAKAAEMAPKGEGPRKIIVASYIGFENEAAREKAARDFMEKNIVPGSAEKKRVEKKVSDIPVETSVAVESKPLEERLKDTHGDERAAELLKEYKSLKKAAFSSGTNTIGAAEVWPHLMPNNSAEALVNLAHHLGHYHTRVHNRYDLYVPLVHALPEYLAEVQGKNLNTQQKAEILIKHVEKSIADHAHDWDSKQKQAAEDLADLLRRTLDGKDLAHLREDVVACAEELFSRVPPERAAAMARLKLDSIMGEPMQFDHATRSHSKNSLNYDFSKTPVELKLTDGRELTIKKVECKDGNLTITYTDKNSATAHKDLYETIKAGETGTGIVSALMKEMQEAGVRQAASENNYARAQLLAGYLDRVAEKGVEKAKKELADELQKGSPSELALDKAVGREYKFEFPTKIKIQLEGKTFEVTGIEWSNGQPRPTVNGTVDGKPIKEAESRALVESLLGEMSRAYMKSYAAAGPDLQTRALAQYLDAQSAEARAAELGDGVIARVQAENPGASRGEVLDVATSIKTIKELATPLIKERLGDVVREAISTAGSKDPAAIHKQLMEQLQIAYNNAHGEPEKAEWKALREKVGALEKSPSTLPTELAKMLGLPDPSNPKSFSDAATRLATTRQDGPAMLESTKADVLTDINKAGGPVTTEGKALLKMLDPTGRKGFQQTWQDLVRNLGQSDAKAVLDKCAQLVLDHKMTEPQVKAMLETLGSTATLSSHYKLLKNIDAKALELAARLTSGTNPVIDSTNARDFINFIGNDGLANLAGLDRTAADRVVETFNRARGATADLMASPKWQMADEPRGLHTQRLMSKALIDVIKPGNRLYEDGWRVVPAGDQSMGDRAGADLVLINVKTGKWLPLDVSERSKSKDFYERISRDDYFDRKLNLVDPTGKDLTDFLDRYLEKHKNTHFDCKDLGPPDLSTCRDATARRQSLQEYGDALAKARTLAESELQLAKANKKPIAEIEALEAKVRGVEALQKGQELARNHLVKEQTLQDHAADALARFLKENADHFAKTGDPVPTGPKDVDPAARAAAEQMVRSGPDNEVICREFRDGRTGSTQMPPGHGDFEVKNFHLGTIRKLVDQALDRANIPEAQKALIRQNLDKMKFGEGGAPLTAQEKLLLDQLKIVVREGLAVDHGDGKIWPELRGIHGKLANEAARERMATEGGDKPVVHDTTKSVIDEANKAIYEKRFKVTDKGVEKGGEKSLADLLRDYQEARVGGKQEKIQEALDRVQKALDLSPELAEAVVAAIKKGKGGEFSTLLNEGKFGAALEATMKKARVVIDTTGTVQSGEPKVILRDKDNKLIDLNEVKNFDNKSREFVMKDGRKIPLDSIKTEIHVAAGTDGVTLGRDLLLGQVAAMQETSRNYRANNRSPRMTPEELRNIDRMGLDSFRPETHQVNSEIAKVDARIIGQTLRDAWGKVNSGVPYPEPYTGATQAEREQMDLAIEQAIEDMRTLGLEEKQASRMEDLMRRSMRETTMPADAERPAFDAVHRNASPTGPGEDLLFRPGTTLSKDEAEKFKKELDKFGKNPLADRATMEKFMQALMEKTRAWQQDLKPEHERLQRLGREVQAADLTMKALAVAEAQLKLGPDAQPELVNAYAEKLLTGEIAAEKNGSFEQSKAYYERVRSDHAAGTARLTEVTNLRKAELQKAANEFCKANGLPEVKINVVEHLSGSGGTYKPGTGEINLPRTALLDRAGGIRATNGIFHEVVHLAQDQLIVRMLADNAGKSGSGLEKPINFTKSTPEQYEALKKAYKEATGGELTKEFLDSVLHQRRTGRDKPELLTEEQRLKAIEMAKAFKEARPFAQVDEALGNAQRVAAAERHALNAPETGKPALELAKRLADPSNKLLGEQLFGTSDRSRWPEPIRKLIEQIEKGAKDSSGAPEGWNEQAARDQLAQHLDERGRDIDSLRRVNHERYISSLAEKEAHLLGTEMDKLTRREYIDALYGSGTGEKPQARTTDDAAIAKAKENGIKLADQQAMKDFVDKLTAELVNWRDDLTVQWEAGSNKRNAMNDAYDRSLALARAEAAKSGKKGAELEQRARELVENPSAELLKNKEFTEARGDYMQKRTEYYKEFGVIHEALLQRQQQLQSALDKFCGEHNLPKMKLELRDGASQSGGYERGSGTVTLNPHDLLSRSRGPEMLANLVKQSVHAAQDTHLVSSLIDRANGGTDKAPKPGDKLTAEQVKQIKAEYEKRTGSQLDDAFLEQVRSERKSVQTEEQIARADKIATDFKETKQVIVDYENHARDLRSVEAEITRLGSVADNRSASALIERLKGPGGEALCKRLFGVDKVTDLPAEHPVRKLIQQYNEASAGGLRPAAESDKWSENKARLALQGALEGRAQALADAQQKMAADYAQRAHSTEAAAVADAAYREGLSRSPELTRAREGDAQGKDFAEAKARVDARQNEQRYLDLVNAKLKELYPGREKTLTQTEIDKAMERVNSELKLSTGTVEMFGVRFTPEEAKLIAKAGEALRADFAKSNTVSADTQAKAVAERVNNHINPPRPMERSAELPYDPWPKPHELAALGEGRPVAEPTDSGVKLRREGMAEVYSGDRLPTEEEVKRYLAERIKTLGDEIERKDKAGEEVRAEDRVLLESLRKTQEKLSTDAKAYEQMKGVMAERFNTCRAAIGSAVAIGIIVSACLGYWIKFHNHGDRPRGLPPLDLPGA